jgi:hypothetical protein
MGGGGIGGGAICAIGAYMSRRETNGNRVFDDINQPRPTALAEVVVPC